MIKNLFHEKNSKYLPSKKFLIILGICLVLIGATILLFKPSKKENFTGLNTTSSTALALENPTLAELVQKDTDSDGIADWEESLWGTDKNKKATFDNVPDLQYIENKKKDLKVEQIQNNKNLSETDKCARQFFTAYTAMKASGQVTGDAINEFSSALGQKIVDPTIVDKFYANSVKTSVDNTVETRKKYYAEVKKIYEQYQKNGIGNELNIVSTGLANYSGSGNASYDELNVIADAYQSFANKIIGLAVPESLADYHLRIANSAYNTGVAVRNMTKIINDSIIGLSGLSQYQKYSDELIKAVADLKGVLLQ